MTNKRIKNKKEVSETGEILRIVNYIFLVIAFIFLVLLHKEIIALPFVIIWLINNVLISFYTKEIKLRRGNKVSLKKEKKCFFIYQICFVIGIIILVLFELKLLIK